MKSITIHKIDDETERKLVAQAEREGLSLNQLVKRLLRETLGIGVVRQDRRGDFEGFSGSWSEEEAQEFERATAVFEEIDEEVWK